LRGKRWYGYYRKRILSPTTDEEESKLICVALDLKSKMTKSEARDALKAEVTKQTGRDRQKAGYLKTARLPSAGSFVTATFPCERETGDQSRQR
jgi:hypothetical protein